MGNGMGVASSRSMMMLVAEEIQAGIERKYPAVAQDLGTN